jgi:hypothetical protein
MVLVNTRHLHCQCCCSQFRVQTTQQMVFILFHFRISQLGPVIYTILSTKDWKYISHSAKQCWNKSNIINTCHANNFTTEVMYLCKLKNTQSMHTVTEACNTGRITRVRLQVIPGHTLKKKYYFINKHYTYCRCAYQAAPWLCINGYIIFATSSLALKQI